MCTIVLSDYRRDEQASIHKHTHTRVRNDNGEWCEVKAESTSRLMAIAALALAAIRPVTPKETAK